MAVDWERVGREGFDRIVEARIRRLHEPRGEVEAVNGRGGDGGIDIRVTSRRGTRIFQLKYFHDGFPTPQRGRRKAITEFGTSGMVVLVGSSSTGKTRACWEAVQPLAGTGWSLWHPFDPTPAEAALVELARVTPRTVIWLNEAQRYFGDELGEGERIATALHSLLIDPARGPVLVLGTLWPEYATAYSGRSGFGPGDRHTRRRELLAGRLVAVPEQFDETALEQAAGLAAAGDPYLADALPRVRNGRVTQDLAGAPELLHRYNTASAPAKAMLSAAMDARRLGVASACTFPGRSSSRRPRAV
jgi:hypothetical protein